MNFVLLVASHLTYDHQEDGGTGPDGGVQQGLPFPSSGSTGKGENAEGSNSGDHRGTAMAAIAIALAGCGTSSTAGPTAAEVGDSATPSETATAAAPGAGSRGRGRLGRGRLGAARQRGRRRRKREPPGLHHRDARGAARQPVRRRDQPLRDAHLDQHVRDPCTIRGWAGLQLVNDDGVVPTRVRRDGTPRTVTIPSHGYAWERLYWTSELAGDESVPCQPTPTRLWVIPPDQTRHLTTLWNQGPVCGPARSRSPRSRRARPRSY